MNGVIIIFSILALLNFLIFLMAMVRLNANILPSDLAVTEMIAIFTGGFTALYTASAIYLRKGVYAFYFIGTSVFLLTTLYFTNSYMDHDGEFFLWYTLPRLVILALLLRYFNRVLRLARNYQEKNHDDVLDDNLLTPHFQ